jgi:hypothetical protein
MNSEPKMNFQNPLDLINFVLEERLHRARKSILESEISIQLPEDFLDSLLQNRETSEFFIFQKPKPKASSFAKIKIHFQKWSSTNGTLQIFGTSLRSKKHASAVSELEY